MSSHGSELSPVGNKELVGEQNVVPLDHVEAVLNRVIPDLEHALHAIQDNSSQVTPTKERCITKNDLEQALAMMRLQMVTEIRSYLHSFFLFFIKLTP